MDVNAFIASGLIDNYCLGLCSPEEHAEIEQFSITYPAIQSEIRRLQLYFEEQVLAKPVKPPVSVKISVMRQVYKQQAGVKHEFVPLIENDNTIAALRQWLSRSNISSPVPLPGEDLFITPLASTDQVTNFMVVAINGHPPEVHEDFVEYLFIIEGGCRMTFDGKEKSYAAGDIITILPRIIHSAVVTPGLPMLALVQRQHCA